MTLSNDENGVTIRGQQCLDDCIDVLQVTGNISMSSLIQLREFGESVIQGRCHWVASRMNHVEPTSDTGMKWEGVRVFDRSRNNAICASRFPRISDGFMMPIGKITNDLRCVCNVANQLSGPREFILNHGVGWEQSKHCVAVSLYSFLYWKWVEQRAARGLRSNLAWRHTGFDGLICRQPILVLLHTGREELETDPAKK